VNPRALLIVAVIAIICVGLAIIGGNQSSRSSVAGAALLPGLRDSLNDVDKIVVVRGGSEPVATLLRTEEGWVAEENGGYPADIVTIRRALIALAEARILEEKTADESFYARLGVEAIELESASGTAVTISAGDALSTTLILGEIVNDTNRYARKADEARSVLIDRSPELPRTTARWLNPNIIDIRSGRVRSVTITHADGERLVVSKSTVEQTNFDVAEIPDGRELLYPGVANTIGAALRELRLDDVAPAAQSPPEPSVVTEFRTFDGLVVTLTGSVAEDQNWITIGAALESQQTGELSAAPVDDLAGTEVDATPPDPRAEAATINARVANWRYRIPEYQFDQLARRQSDLLRVPD
jgi:hypothetical protein